MSREHGEPNPLSCMIFLLMFDRAMRCPVEDDGSHWMKEEPPISGTRSRLDHRANRVVRRAEHGARCSRGDGKSAHHTITESVCSPEVRLPPKRTQYTRRRTCSCTRSHVLMDGYNIPWLSSGCASSSLASSITRTEMRRPSRFSLSQSDTSVSCITHGVP